MKVEYDLYKSPPREVDGEGGGASARPCSQVKND